MMLLPCGAIRPHIGKLHTQQNRSVETDDASHSLHNSTITGLHMREGWRVQSSNVHTHVLSKQLMAWGA